MKMDDNKEPSEDMGAVLARVFALIEARSGADPEQSYVARLLAKGPRKIAQKVGEEAVETVIAGTSGNRDELIGESADLMFHLMVLWAARGIAPGNVAAELARREGVSGIVEKKSRNW